MLQNYTADENPTEPKNKDYTIPTFNDPTEQSSVLLSPDGTEMRFLIPSDYSHTPPESFCSSTP
jgi:hypothetical protein